MTNIDIVKNVLSTCTKEVIYPPPPLPRDRYDQFIFCHTQYRILFPYYECYYFEYPRPSFRMELNEVRFDKVVKFAPSSQFPLHC